MRPASAAMLDLLARSSSPPTTTWLSEAGPHARGASGSKGAGRTLVRTPWAPHVLAGSWPI